MLRVRETDQLALPRSHPSVVHVEDSLRPTKEIGLCVQGSEYQLAIQAAHFFDKTQQVSAVELRRRVVKQERRGQRRPFLQHLNLRQGHRNRDQLLLSSR